MITCVANGPLGHTLNEALSAIYCIPDCPSRQWDVSTHSSPLPPPPLPGLELVVEDRPTELSCTCIILCAYQLINVCAFFSLSLLLLYLLQAMVALTLGSLP